MIYYFNFYRSFSKNILSKKITNNIDSHRGSTKTGESYNYTQHYHPKAKAAIINLNENSNYDSNEKYTKGNFNTTNTEVKTKNVTEEYYYPSEVAMKKYSKEINSIEQKISVLNGDKSNVNIILIIFYF